MSCTLMEPEIQTRDDPMCCAVNIMVANVERLKVPGVLTHVFQLIHSTCSAPGIPANMMGFSHVILAGDSHYAFSIHTKFEARRSYVTLVYSRVLPR